jgi:hypothetical protein
MENTHRGMTIAVPRVPFEIYARSAYLFTKNVTGKSPRMVKPTLTETPVLKAFCILICCRGVSIRTSNIIYTISSAQKVKEIRKYSKNTIGSILIIVWFNENVLFGSRQHVVVFANVTKVSRLVFCVLQML